MQAHGGDDPQWLGPLLEQRKDGYVTASVHMLRRVRRACERTIASEWTVLIWDTMRLEWIRLQVASV